MAALFRVTQIWESVLAITTLLSLALVEGLIDATILSRMSDDKNPSACLARNAEEVLQCAGSSYIACPVLEALNHLPEYSEERLAAVTTPCQGLALAKMRKEPPQNRVNMDKIRLVIGLFCTWALSPDEFHKYLKEKLDLPQVIKFDIPPPPADRFDVDTPSGRASFPQTKSGNLLCQPVVTA